MVPRRRFLKLAGAAVAMSAGVSGVAPASAQVYPTRPVRLVVATAAGATTDIIARLMAQFLSERLGQPFLIENRPGGGNTLGTEAVVRAPPDGYTLLLVNAVNAINVALFEKLNYVNADIVPVAGIIRVPLVMQVNPSVPAKTVPEFITYARANPGKINMASAGTGSTPHVAGELFKMMTGLDLVHVPYRGGAPAMTEVGRSAREHRGAEVGEARLQLGIGEAGIDRLVERTDDFGGRALGRTDAVPGTRLVARHEFADGGQVRQRRRARRGGHRQGAQPARADVLQRPGHWLEHDLDLPADEIGALIAEETEKWGRVVKFSGAKAE